MDDPDLSIRSQSLHLISSIVNEDTLYEITKKLMLHLSTENENSASFTSEIIEYRSLVASVIINSCTKDSYQYLGDFEWFIDVLSDVCKFNGLNLGKLASDELINVCVRVSDVRGYALRKSRELVFNSLLLHDGTEGCGILVAAAWITGEYATVDTIDLDLLESFLSQDVFGLSPEAQSAYLYAFFKLFIKFKKKHENVNVSIFTSLLDRFVNSTNFEIQERV